MAESASGLQLRQRQVAPSSSPGENGKLNLSGEGGDFASCLVFAKVRAEDSQKLRLATGEGGNKCPIQVVLGLQIIHLSTTPSDDS